MNVKMLEMITVTQKIETIEVMIFLVTTISTMNEKVMAIAIPLKALVTNALSTAMDVHAPQVYFIPSMEGALVLATSIWSSM